MEILQVMTSTTRPAPPNMRSPMLAARGTPSNIDAVDQAAQAYPWKTTYRVFPGPNSNTFVAWVARQVPELELDLPFSAIGSGYVRQAD